MSEEVKVEESVEDLFNAAFAKSKSERKEREGQRKGNGSGGSFEKITWFGLEHAVEKIFRICGFPIEMRKNGTDAKLVYHSKMLNDKKDGYMNIFWKTNEDGTINEDWILYKLYSFVMKKEWSSYEDGVKNDKGHTGEYIFAYKDTETFKRLDANIKKDASPKFYAPSSKFKARVLMNVIDRHDDWCKDNKHTKILSSKCNFWKNDDKGNPIIFSDMGVPEMVYNKIMDDVVQFRHNWNLDIVIKKNKDDLNNAYVVRDIREDKLEEETLKLGNDNPLTDEENQYEMYNFDEMTTFRVTSYYTMYKRLIGLFKMFDAEFNQNFTEDLERLVEIEQKEISEKETEKISKDFEKEIKEEKSEAPKEESVKEEKIEKPAEETPTSAQRRSAPQEGSEELDQYIKTFPSFMNLSKIEQEEMKKCITSFENGIPVYANPSDALPCMDKNCKYPDSDIETTFPSKVVICPVCSKNCATS